MHHLHLFAGLAWNPGIRGILVVAVGVAVLMGSVYLLLATNPGARLGMLVALAGPVRLADDPDLRRWLLAPPANGPRGNNPRGSRSRSTSTDRPTPKTARSWPTLPEPQNLADRPTGSSPDHPELAKEYPNGFVLSDLAGQPPRDRRSSTSTRRSSHGWRLVRRRPRR